MQGEMAGGQKTRVMALVVIATLLGALFLTAAPAGAQDAETCAIDITDYEGSATISTDNISPEAGETITFTGTGFPPNTVVPLAVNGESIGSPTTDETGAFSFTYTVPTDLAPGAQLEFSATCGAFVLTQTITISAPGVTPPTTPTQQPLPVTGGDFDWAIRAGLALIAVGGLVVLAVRRRSELPAAV